MKPAGVSVAPDGRIFIADYGAGEVKTWDASYDWVQILGEYGIEPGQLKAPAEISFDADDDAYVTEHRQDHTQDLPSPRARHNPAEFADS